MEPYHGKRGRESSLVCGMNRGKQTKPLMFVMVVSMMLVLVWEASPFTRSTTPIHAPGNNLNELELRIDSFKSRPLPNTDDSDSSAPLPTQGDATPNLVGGQNFKDLPEVAKQQDRERNIVEATTTLPDSDLDENDARIRDDRDVPEVTGTEDKFGERSNITDAMLRLQRVNETEIAGALEAVSPFESLRSSSEGALVPESEETASLEVETAEILAGDKASGYDSKLRLNATRQVEELTGNSFLQKLTGQLVDQSEEQSLGPREVVAINVDNWQTSKLLDDVALVKTDGQAELETVASPDNRDATENLSMANDGAIDQEKPAPESDESSKTKVCDYTIGKWVLDETRPLYSGRECTVWLSPDFACRRHNHPDKMMDRYRWQPAGCDLPTFNASVALETLRNKVVAFVGDSLGRQQLQSLLCMLTRGKNTTTLTNVGSMFNFYTPRGARKPTGFAYRFDATNTTLVFKWTVTLARVQPLNNNNNTNALHLDRPDQFLQDHLHQLNILVLNSGHHWNTGKMQQNQYQFYNSGKPVPPSSPLSQVPVAYNQTIHNVVKWLHTQLGTKQTQPRQVIYYRSLSPRHFRNGDWNTGGTCDRIRFEGEKRVEEGMRVDVNAESAVAGTGVRLLNATSLSLERGETHVSKYGGGKSGQDCLHWCLPGVPDTWNEILLAELGEEFRSPSQSQSQS